MAKWNCNNRHSHLRRSILIALTWGSSLLSYNFGFTSYLKISRLRACTREALVYIITSWHNDTVIGSPRLKLRVLVDRWWHIMVVIPIGRGATHAAHCVRLCVRVCLCGKRMPVYNLNIHFSNAITIHYSTLNAA